MKRDTRAIRAQRAKDRAHKLSRQFLRFNAFTGFRMGFSIVHQDYVAVSFNAMVREYGKNCAELFRLIYRQHQRGGRSMKTGASWVSRWEYDVDAGKAYIKVLDKLQKHPDPTAKMALDEMKGLGFVPMTRWREWDDEFDHVLNEGYASGEELKVIRAGLREARIRLDFMRQKAKNTTN